MALVHASDTASLRSSIRSSATLRRADTSEATTRRTTAMYSVREGTGSSRERSIGGRWAGLSRRWPRPPIEAMENTLVSPVISNTLRMRAWVQTRERSPPWLRRRFKPADQHAQPGRVQEVHPFEVDDDLAMALADQLDELLAQPRRAVHVDLTLDRENRERRSAVVYLQPELHEKILPCIPALQIA